MSEIKKIPVAGVSHKMPYCYRYRLQDETLMASVRRHGVLMPILVADAARPVVIAGHKRLAAAKALRIKEVLVLGVGQVKPREAFLLNLISNWKQQLSEMDRSKALAMAIRQFHLKESEVIECVMPLLGLGKDRGAFELYHRADALPEAFKEFLEDGTFSFRGIPFFLRFSKTDQNYFAKKIAPKIRLTSSQLIQVGEWLNDLMKKTGKDLKVIFRNHPVLKDLARRDMDPRTKADRFFNAVKQLRFPDYSVYLEAFAKRRADILRGEKSIRLEPVEGFEEKGFELRARVKNAAALEALLRKISEQRPALNSLFDVML